MGKIIGLIAVLVVGGSIFFFFGKNNQKASAPTVSEMGAAPSIQQKAAPLSGEMDDAALISKPNTQEILIKANNWYFEPEEISVKEGARVKIILEGVSGVHAFAIPELGVKSETVSPGEKKTIEFSADKKGEFSFKCAFLCGEGHSGMIGKLIVE